jgi:hypothetical protein
VVPPKCETPCSCIDFDSLKSAMVTAVTACTLVPAIWQYSSVFCKFGIAIANSLQCPSTNWSPEGWFRTGTGVGIFYLHHRVEMVSGAHPLPSATCAEALLQGMKRRAVLTTNIHSFRAHSWILRDPYIQKQC